MSAIAHFQPSTTSFGNLVIRQPRAIRTHQVWLDRHRNMVLGLAFAAAFITGLGCLYALDQSTFADRNLQPSAYSAMLLDID